MPGIVQALEAVARSLEAAAANSANAAAAAGPEPGGGQLAAPHWAALLSHATAELGAVQALLPLPADWKAQISAAYTELLQQLLASRRAQEQGAMLAGFRAALMSGRRRLPLTGADAAQVGGLPRGLYLSRKNRAQLVCICFAAWPGTERSSCLSLTAHAAPRCRACLPAL